MSTTLIAPVDAMPDHERRRVLSRISRWRYLPWVGWILLAAIPVIVLW